MIITCDYRMTSKRETKSVVCTVLSEANYLGILVQKFDKIRLVFFFLKVDRTSLVHGDTQSVLFFLYFINHYEVLG